MRCIIVKAELSEFTGSKGEVMKGVSLTVLREKDYETKRYWKMTEALQKAGFKDSMISDPFQDDELSLTEITFDETKSGKITPTSFKAL